jgi:hypothetical protein
MGCCCFVLFPALSLEHPQVVEQGVAGPGALLLRLLLRVLHPPAPSNTELPNTPLCVPDASQTQA